MAVLTSRVNPKKFFSENEKMSMVAGIQAAE
jgi:hypothetical protein